METSKRIKIMDSVQGFNTPFYKRVGVIYKEMAERFLKEGDIISARNYIIYAGTVGADEDKAQRHEVAVRIGKAWNGRKPV